MSAAQLSRSKRCDRNLTSLDGSVSSSDSRPTLSVSANAASTMADNDNSSTLELNPNIEAAREEGVLDGFPHETIFISMASYRDRECNSRPIRFPVR